MSLRILVILYKPASIKIREHIVRDTYYLGCLFFIAYMGQNWQKYYKYIIGYMDTS